MTEIKISEAIGGWILEWTDPYAAAGGREVYQDRTALVRRIEEILEGRAGN